MSTDWFGSVGFSPKIEPKPTANTPTTHYLTTHYSINAGDNGNICFLC